MLRHDHHHHGKPPHPNCRNAPRHRAGSAGRLGPALRAQGAGRAPAPAGGPPTCAKQPLAHRLQVPKLLQRFDGHRVDSDADAGALLLRVAEQRVCARLAHLRRCQPRVRIP